MGLILVSDVRQGKDPYALSNIEKNSIRNTSCPRCSISVRLSKESIELILCYLVKDERNYIQAISDYTGKSKSTVNNWIKKGVRENLIYVNSKDSKPVFYSLTERGEELLKTVDKDRLSDYIESFSKPMFDKQRPSSVPDVLRLQVRDFLSRGWVRAHKLVIGYDCLSGCSIDLSKVGGRPVYRSKGVLWYKLFDFEGYQVAVYSNHVQLFAPVALGKSRAEAQAKQLSESLGLLERFAMRLENSVGRVLDSKFRIIRYPELGVVGSGVNIAVRDGVAPIERVKVVLPRGEVWTDFSPGDPEAESMNPVYAENLKSNFDVIPERNLGNLATRDLFEPLDLLNARMTKLEDLMTKQFVTINKFIDYSLKKDEFNVSQVKDDSKQLDLDGFNGGGYIG